MSAVGLGAPCEAVIWRPVRDDTSVTAAGGFAHSWDAASGQDLLLYVAGRTKDGENREYGFDDELEVIAFVDIGHDVKRWDVLRVDEGLWAGRYFLVVHDLPDELTGNRRLLLEETRERPDG